MGATSEDPPTRWRSAIKWRDITAGAQTERRGGAGPAGACLAVRTPPAALLCPHFVIRGPRRVTTVPFHFLGVAGLSSSSGPSVLGGRGRRWYGATSKVRSSLQSVQTPLTRARTFQRQPRRFGFMIPPDPFRKDDEVSVGLLMPGAVAFDPITYR